MKRLLTKTIDLPMSLIAIFGFLSLCLCVSVVNSPAQDWKSVADGVEYAQVRREFSGKSVDINLLRLDLKKVRLDVHHAFDRAIGTEKTSSIATRHKAFAAINAGFFRLDNSNWAGDAAGVLLIDKILYSESASKRVAIGIINGKDFTTVNITRIERGLGVKHRDDFVRCDGVNRERGKDDIVLFLPGFGQSTLTDSNGIEVIVRGNRISAIIEGKGSAAIPSDGFVLSASGSKKERLLKLQNQGLRVSLTDFVPMTSYEVSAQKFFPTEDIVGGVPQLIKGGKIDITWEEEKASRSFVETRHPRTAVAKLKDGKFLMLTADGRSEQSAGLDLYDLAKYMLELGAVDAMNLDGGGSTTMFLDGKVVNKPSDKDGERKIGDAILVTLRKPASKK